MNALADPIVAIHWVTRLAGLAVFLSSLELLSLRREFLPGGFYHCDRELARLTNRTPVTPGVWIAASLYPAFYAIIGVRLLLGVLLLLDAPTGPWRPILLFAAAAITLFIGSRLEFGMSAADTMAGIVLCGLGFTALVPGNALVQRMGLWFLALQTTVAYTAAGVTKLYIPAWRDGAYLATALGSATYGSPFAARFMRDRRLALLASWTVIVWECSFPLALLAGAPVAIAYCALAALFHAAIGVFMGLKMFVFVFGSTYPAIVACAIQIHLLMKR